MTRIKIEFNNGNMYSRDLDTGEMTPIYAAVPIPEEASRTILRVASSKNNILEEDEFSDAIVNTIDRMQSPEFLEKFKLENPENLSELVTEQMQHSKLSLGLLQTLHLLNGVDINLMVDDSGSMTAASDIPLAEMHPEFFKRYEDFRIHKNSFNDSVLKEVSHDNSVLTRWGEANNQLFTYIERLACVPTGTITIRYFNRRNLITITPEDRKKYTINELKQKIYDELWKQTIANQWGLTPTYALLQHAFSANSGEVLHVLITDGTPSDCTRSGSTYVDGKYAPIYPQLIELVRTRGLGYGLEEPSNSLATNSKWKEVLKPEKLEQIQKKSQDNPLMLLSCTKEDLTYFNTLDSDSYCVDAMDDFLSEARQTRKAHGEEFPYTREVWLLKQLVGAKSKFLDALDEISKLYTKEAYEIFTGYKISESVYKAYVAYKLSINVGNELTCVAPNGDETKYREPIKHDLDADKPLSPARIAPNSAFLPETRREQPAIVENNSSCGCTVM